MLLVYQPPLSISGKGEKHICNKLKGGIEGSTGRRGSVKWQWESVKEQWGSVKVQLGGGGAFKDGEKALKGNGEV